MSFKKPQTPLTPEQQMQRQQRIGLALSALSDAVSYTHLTLPTILRV